MRFSTEFTHALCRAPSASITDGLRAIDTGTPDLALFQQHHRDYVAALESTGATVEVLPPLQAYPDAVFVEDTALCLPQGAVILHPGAPSRAGEAAEMAPHLKRLYGAVHPLPRGRAEGGDILTTEREILVGLSHRTTAEGVDALSETVAPWGYSVRRVEVPAGVLHFKTDCALLDAETILSTARLAASGCFDGYRVLLVPEGEEACANAIRFNDLVLIPAGFPRTRALLDQAGYQVTEIGNSEAAKVDGGLSCLSLRFSPPAR